MGPSTGLLWPARVVWTLLGLDVGLVLAVSLMGLGASSLPGAFSTWAGRATGQVAELSILAQVLLAARVPVLERAFGQPGLLRAHRLLGPLTVFTLVAHPVLLALGGVGGQAGALPGAVVDLGKGYLLPTVATLVMLLVTAVSLRAVRRVMRWELWYALHLTTYACVIAAFSHQVGGDTALGQYPVLVLWWRLQLVVVFAAVVTFRVGWPVARTLRTGLRVTDVTRESADVFSVWITGRGLDRLGVRGGQYVHLRFLSQATWTTSYPFSLSRMPDRYGIRVTVQVVGDGTSALARLPLGTRVVIEGPYGTLTDEVRTTGKVLLIGTGTGIVPLRSLLEDLPPAVDAVVVHRVRDADHAPLRSELEALTRGPRRAFFLLAGSRTVPGNALDAQSLRRLCPDVGDRDVYLCGNDTFVREVSTALRRCRVPARRLHVEEFAL